jgi:hypothetical protein
VCVSSLSSGLHYNMNHVYENTLDTLYFATSEVLWILNPSSIRHRVNSYRDTNSSELLASSPVRILCWRWKRLYVYTNLRRVLSPEDCTFNSTTVRTSNLALTDVTGHVKRHAWPIKSWCFTYIYITHLLVQAYVRSPVSNKNCALWSHIV